MKRVVTILAAVLVAGAAGGAQAQVYKCKVAGGYAYQGTPCNPDAQPIKVQGSRAATMSEAELATRQAVFKSTDRSSAAISEQQCLSGASGRIYGASNQRVADYQQQIAALNQQILRANNNLAGATLESGLRGQVASLQSSIGQERSSADAQMTSARQQCAEQRAAAERAIEQKYAAGRS